MKRVLILGGGFGGVSAAHRLRELLPDDEVVLVDRGTHFMMGFHKNAIVVGREKPGTGMRPLAALERLGVRVRQATIERIDPAAHAAVVDGETIEADALLVALGAEVASAAVPGLADHGIGYYSAEGAAAAAAALAALGEGRVLIGVFGAPYSCPPAPFELALLAVDAARERGVRHRIGLFTPLPVSLPILGAAGCNPLETRLVEQGIEFRPNAKAERVEAGRAVFAGGGAMPFDLLIAVPPHRCPAVCVEAGLAPAGGWIAVDRQTLATGIEGVWAVGDATAIPLANGQALPKAGALADREGRVAAEGIAASLTGGASGAVFAGEGACFLEVGRGEAMLVEGNFFADPPDVHLTAPSVEAMAQKESFERDRLDAWFGPAA